MTKVEHPSPLVLSRVACEDVPPEEIEAHLACCAACAAAWSSIRRVDSLARMLPGPAVSKERGEAVLAAVLLAARERSTRGRRALRWWHVVVPAATLAAAAALVLATRGGARTGEQRVAVAAVAATDPGPTYRAAVRAQGDARFERLSSAPDEVVRVFEGTISVDVSQLAPGERFRVIADDAEVEGGRSYQVTAARGALVAVQAIRGRVEIRPARRAIAVLVAGQRWEAAAETSRDVLVASPRAVAPVASPAAVAPVARPPAAVAPVARPQSAATVAVPAHSTPRMPLPHAEQPMAKLFDRGWRELNARDLVAAIDTFGEGLAKYPRDPLAEDAAFWRGVALVRAKRTREAVTALASFIDGYRSSPRVGEASAILGWTLLETGDVGGAERRFQAASADPLERVQISARKGLAAVDQLRRSGRADLHDSP